MSRAIADLSEMDPTLRMKLLDAGIETADELLTQGATPEQRRQLAQRLGVDEHRLTEWVNLADLMRLQGVDVPTANLIRAAGIHSCQELRDWNPQALLSRLILVNDKEEIIGGQFLTLPEVEDWIKEAAALSTPHANRLKD